MKFKTRNEEMFECYNNMVDLLAEETDKEFYKNNDVTLKGIIKNRIQKFKKLLTK